MATKEVATRRGSGGTHLTITISCSPGSFMYAGSECVEIWLGVLLVLLGRRALPAVPFCPPVAAAVVFEPGPASWSAVSATVVPVVAPAACAAPAPQLSSVLVRSLRPPHATAVPTTKSEAITTSGIYNDRPMRRENDATARLALQRHGAVSVRRDVRTHIAGCMLAEFPPGPPPPPPPSPLFCRGWR